MSMPHGFIPVNCVVELQTTKRRATIVVYKDPKDIRKLHPYFKTGTIAADILASTPKFSERSVTATSRLHLVRIKAGWKNPKPVKEAPRKARRYMEPGYYYWHKK